MDSGKILGHFVKYFCDLSTKEIKNAPSQLLSYISTRDFFNNTREVLEKHEPQANASRTSRV